MLTTGLIGGATSAAAYSVSKYARGCEISGRELAVAAGTGFLAGLTAPFVGPVGNAGVGGAANVVQDFINKNGNMSLGELAESFAWGAGGAAAGGSYKRGVGMDYGTAGDWRWVDKSNAMRDLAKNATGSNVGRQFGGNAGAAYGGSNPCTCSVR